MYHLMYYIARIIMGGAPKNLAPGNHFLGVD